MPEKLNTEILKEWMEGTFRSIEGIRTCLDSLSPCSLLLGGPAPHFQAATSDRVLCHVCVFTLSFSLRFLTAHVPGPSL